MKKQNKKTSVVLLIVGILFLGLAVFFAAIKGNYMLTGKAWEINDLLLANTFDSHKGDTVRVKVDAVIENYAETKHTTNGIPTGTDQHYVVWLDDDSVISVVVPGKKSADLDRVMDETWSYLNDEAEQLTTNPVTIEGELTSLTGELRGFFDEAVDYYSLDDNFEIRYYQIDTTNSRLMMILEELLFLALGIIPICLFIFGKKAEKKAAADAAQAAAADPFAAYDKDPFAAADGFGTADSSLNGSTDGSLDGNSDGNSGNGAGI